MLHQNHSSGMSNLSDTFCLDVTAFKDFLRQSRALVDDTITQNLNNLVLPPRFDPNSTSRPEKKNLKTPIDKNSCNNLLETIFQNWDARTTTIDYCSQKAASEISLPHHAPTSAEVRARRLDPYSGRQEEDDSILRRVCQQEQGTERIVRDRTWRVVRGRCDTLTGMSDDWQTAFDQWRSAKAAAKT